MGKTIKYGLGICILVLLTGLYSFVDKKYPVYDTAVPTEEFILCDEVSEGTEYSQTFVNVGKSLKAVNVKCVVNDEDSAGILNYAICDENGKEIRLGEKKICDLKSAKFNNFSFDPIEESEGKTYTFKIWSEEKAGSSVSLYKIFSTKKGTHLMENQNEVEGTLVLRSVTHMFDWETFVVVLCFLAYIIVFIRILYKFFR